MAHQHSDDYSDHDDHPHAHSHSHDHSHAHIPPGSEHQKAFLIATSVNFIFVITEAVYALIAHSMSLLADAGHNFADVIGLAFAFAANWLLTKPASSRYSYGYKKTTMLAALFNAFLLVFTTGIIAYESILRFFHPVPVTEEIIMIIAGLGILINGGTALLFIKNTHNDLNIKSAFSHLAGDALISLGVVITGAAMLWTHWLWLDPLVGFILAMVILFGAWGLVRESVNLILDAVPKHINEQSVKAYLGSLTGVKAVHDLHIWGLSTRQTALTAHLVMPETSYISDQDFKAIKTKLKKDFKINHITLQVERGDSLEPCEQTERC